MYVSIGFAVGSLAIQGVSPHSLFGPREFLVANRNANTTAIVSGTTVTSQSDDQGRISSQGSVNSTREVIKSALTDTPTPVAVVIGPQTMSQDTVPNSAVVTVDGTSLTGNTESGFIIGPHTPHMGSAITTGNQVVTLPSPAATQAPSSTITQTPETVPVILIGNSTFTQNTASAIIIGSQTLSPGSAVTISGQVISLSPTGNALILHGATARQIPTTFSTEIQAPVTSLVVAGMTLTAGGIVTVGGDVSSLIGGAITIIGTVTVAAEQAAPTAKPTGEKSLAGRFESTSNILMASQICFVVGLGVCGLF
ncbi:hypothetical protein WAI453_007050 [Rhynchosporium graminicola]